MRFFLSVGEPSGDLHAANLIQRLRALDPSAEFTGFGGPKMQSVGCNVLFDLTRLGVMFLSGVISNLRLFFRLIAQADELFERQDFDAVILIDYPGLNWWIARKARKHGIKVFYYGVPQMWAWAPWRIKKIRKYVDYVICKLPFEPQWFRERGCQAHYVGHPYFDELEKKKPVNGLPAPTSSAEQSLLLLPGSRRIELERNLGTLFNVARQVNQLMPNVRIVMGCLNDEHRELALAARSPDVPCEIHSNRTLELMSSADACVACSGSVSLELLHYRLPTVIVYRIGLIKMLLQTLVLRCKFITLTNLMNATDIRKSSWWPHDPEIDQDPVLMPEYLSWRDCSAQATNWIVQWLKSDELHAAKCCELDQLAGKYAVAGASRRAADFIYSKLDNRRLTRAVA